MQSRSVTEAVTTRCDSRAPQRGALIGTFAADFPSGPAAKTPRMQAGYMKATVRTASAKKPLPSGGVSNSGRHLDHCAHLRSSALVRQQCAKQHLAVDAVSLRPPTPT